MPSFDVVSNVDRQEVDNALNQTRKEVGQRYDFKGSKTEIREEENIITVISDDDFKVKAVVDVLQSKLVRRGVSLKSLVYGDIEPSAGGLARQTITVQQGIETEKAKQLVKAIKDSKLKVQSQIQGDQVRVTGKKRDDLQDAIKLLKEQDVGLPLQFVNFRD
ncbi:MAG TPA: YajQ family cyclic di-GMP-binding protein [Candidatus Acidoferrales bacterium]|nr:YajQ family cyclic di-GMP-binding protein [Candidatus Acidoferrales bacterium]